jgi:hypothetical protein
MTKENKGRTESQKQRRMTRSTERLNGLRKETNEELPKCFGEMMMVR